MASLPLSSLPSGSLHLDAFRGLNYSLGRGLGDNEFILTTIRRYGEHEVEDRINIWILSRRNGGVYVSASCAGTQCCPCAPQGDIQYLLFKNGDWLKGDNERILISHSDEPCSGAQETDTLDGSDRALVSGTVPCGGGQETGALTESASSHSVAPACEIDRTSDHSTKTIRPTQLMSHKRPTEGDSVVVAKILSGLTSILLGELDYSNAIITAWEGNKEKEISSLLDLWDQAAVRNADVTSIIMLTEQRTMKSRGEAEYLHWLGKIMAGCLVFAQTKGKLLPKTFRKENKFIKWTRRLPKLLRLLQPAGITGLLILKAFGNSFYSFTELDRQSESNLENFLETEWAKIRPTLLYIHHRLQGHSVLEKKVSIFNPIALCCRYLQKQRKRIKHAEMCQIFDASGWVQSEVFELKTIRELLPPQVLVTGSIRRQVQLTKEGKNLVAALDKLVLDEEPQPTSAAERQTPPSQQGTTSCGPSYSRPRFDPVRDIASPCHSEGAASGQRTTAVPLSRQSHADLQLSPVAFDQFAREDSTAQTDLFAGRLSPRGSSNEAISLSLADPAPGASVQRNIMPDASVLDQMLSCRAVRDPNALANAASQTFPLHFDGDSGYGDSTVSSQFLMATSAMPIPFGDSETADPCSRLVSLCGPERPNNVPARLIGGHRTALPEEAPPPAALATGSNSTTWHLPVLDSTSDEVAADGPPVGTNRRPHTAGQKRSAESEGSDHRPSRRRHNASTPQGSPPAGNQDENFDLSDQALEVSQARIFDLSDQALEDSQTWNFDLSDQALEVSQARIFDLSDQALEDSQTWNFDLSDQASEDSQTWNFDLSDQASEDSQTWNFDLSDQAFSKLGGLA